MTGMEIVLFLTGCVFMVGSFFVAEKLSPSELSKIGELSEDELKRIIDREITNAGPKIEDAIETRIEASAENVDRALEKETNEKIMAISEYSDTVLENINKAHNEIMFLYSMLNDKHTELTGMVSDLQRLAADVRNLKENIKTAEEPVAPEILPQESFKEVVLEELSEKETDVSTEEVAADNLKKGDSVKKEILKMYKEGIGEIEIAKRLQMGVGEVRLIIGLYRGE